MTSKWNVRQNDRATDETGEKAVSWRSVKRSNDNDMQHSRRRTELPYMHGEGAEKSGAVGFGDVQIDKPLHFSCGDFCVVLFRVQYADCVGSRMKSLAFKSPNGCS